jgi:hypothetical protein
VDEPPAASPAHARGDALADFTFSSICFGIAVVLTMPAALQPSKIAGVPVSGHVLTLAPRYLDVAANHRSEAKPGGHSNNIMTIKESTVVVIF